MATLEDLTRLKRLVEQTQQRAAQAKGAQDEVMRNMADAFGVNTVDAAQTLLVTLKAKEAKTKTAFDAAYEGFLKEYGPLLEG